MNGSYLRLRFDSMLMMVYICITFNIGLGQLTTNNKNDKRSNWRAKDDNNDRFVQVEQTPHMEWIMEYAKEVSPARVV